jgi:hypothetical protein
VVGGQGCRHHLMNQDLAFADDWAATAGHAQASVSR